MKTMRNFCYFFLFLVLYKPSDCLVEQDFSPVVSATCKQGYMTIRVVTNSSFNGAVHAKDHRTAGCMTNGNGTNVVTLTINLLAPQQSPEFCGVLVSNKTDERSVPLAVRIHKTLELADDKFYVITCGKSGFKNAQNETLLVSLKILDHKTKTKRLPEVFYGHPYTVRAQISKPDNLYSIKVRSCSAFNRKNDSVELLDSRGCPVNKQVMTPFVYNSSLGWADAEILQMFQFPDSNQLHLQCDIAVCAGKCVEVDCDDDLTPEVKDLSEQGVIVASASAFILQPGDKPTLGEIVEAGYGQAWGPSWLVYLCIALGLLFLLMLIVNVFLCSAMTCSCARTEIIEKEPSIIEEYDPYRTWHGSNTYGSRYSLNGKPGYLSGGSTLNSARSISTNSDHYAIVDSRHRRSPPSHIHYSRKH